MKIKFCYLAAHEQYSPRDLLEQSILAEKEGFDMIASSDHFHPWMHTNSHGGFAWVWLGAVAEKTSKIALGTAVTAPTLRYNPAIVAQAFATLAYMYPGRIFLGLGTGEAINEVPVGCSWPNPRERVERLEEAIKIIKALWEKNFVTFNGKYYKLKNANLYTKPKEKIPLYIAAGGLKVAKIAGKYGDGIITIMGALKKYGEKFFSSFNEEAKKVGKNPEEMLKAIVLNTSYDDNYERAVKAARYWASTALPFVFKYEIFDPREVEANAVMVGDKQLASVRLITNNPQEYIDKIEELLRIGFNSIFILNSSPDPKKFIKMFGEKIIPSFS